MSAFNYFIDSYKDRLYRKKQYNPLHPHCGPFNDIDDEEPENKVDAACWKHDKVYSKLGSKAYFEYNDADELGALNIDLALKSSKVRKTICSNTDADCLPSILDNNDEPFLLSQDGQRLTTENSVNLYQEFIL